MYDVISASTIVSESNNEGRERGGRVRATSLISKGAILLVLKVLSDGQYILAGAA